MSTQLGQIAKRAKLDRKARFTSLVCSFIDFRTKGMS
jgi:hypothetical protein